MNIELKMEGTGIYPTYFNFASSGGVSQYLNKPSVEFVDFSSISNAYIVIEQAKEINKKDMTANGAPQ